MSKPALWSKKYAKTITNPYICDRQTTTQMPYTIVYKDFSKYTYKSK